jgi:exodeoxyribonuclease VII large subunit
MASALRRWVSARRSRIKQAEEWMADSARTLVQGRQAHVGHLAARLDALSPLSALRRGYAVAVGESGHVLRRTFDFHPGQRFELRVSDGTVPSRVVDPGQESPS